MQILGSDGQLAEVTDESRLKVDAEVGSFGRFSSLAGNAYTANSLDASALAGTHIFYFKNTSQTRAFSLDLMWFSGVQSALWKVWSVTGTAAAGSAITPTNLNLKSGNVAEATSRGNDAITGLTEMDFISVRRTAANSGVTINYDGQLILGLNDAIAVEYDTGTTGIAEVFMRGHYD